MPLESTHLTLTEEEIDLIKKYKRPSTKIGFCGSVPLDPQNF
jgi:hypothetical protein